MKIYEITEGTRCWKGYEKKGMKTMFGKRVPNCVKREHVDFCVNCGDIILHESLNENLKGLYEPVHGSAPDIAGQGIVNPIATILSVGMLMKYSFGEPLISEKIHSAVKKVLSEGFATKDIAQKNSIIVSTSEMGDKIANYVS